MSVPTAFLKTLTDDLASGTLQVLLVTPSYSYDASHVYVTDIVPGTVEASGTYARQTVAGQTSTQNDFDARAEFTCDPVVFSGLDVTGGLVSGAWFYKFVSDDTDSPLRFFVAFSKTTNAQDFTLTPSTNGAVWVVDAS